jgi:tetratricopeptide (TPR) repeat protein
MSGSSQNQQLLSKATALYHSGDYREAIQVWQEVLQQDPENQRAQEGIRMASLLLEEAETSDASTPAPEQSETPQSPEIIAQVRDGIQRVRDCLAASKHLDAMEVCQSLLKMAPRSEAVREILEEAREAYEAQPFIAEHLEIARQLFVQERLDEASAEIQKIYFLNANHAEARKLDAKIQALRQMQGPATNAGPDPDAPAPSSPGSETQRLQMPQELDSAAETEESHEPESGAEGEGESRPILNENWEEELAQLDLAPSTAEAPAEPREVEAEPMPLTDLSEGPGTFQAPAPPEPQADPKKQEPSLSDLDLEQLSGEIVSSRTQKAPDVSWVDAKPAPVEKPRKVARPARIPPRPAPRGGGLPLGKAMFTLLVLAGIAGGGWWFIGQRSASASGQGSGSGAPPAGRAPLKTRPQGQPSSPPGGANVGLSTNTSRPAATTPAQAGLPPLPSAAPPVLSPEELKHEIASLFSKGREQMSRQAYPDAVITFSKVLDLDPANLEAKEQLDHAAAWVLEQKRLEEDFQTAKQFFVEKDYESALRKFYRLPKDRKLEGLDLFIRNAWYNWAVMSMKGGNCPEAIHRLDEVVNADAGDAEAAKLREVAEQYADKPKDKVFYAYVDRLTYRTLNQK